MDFTSWFRQWLRRHPLKEPPALDLERVRYTAEVMARVKAHGQTVWVPARRWAVFPRAAFAMATVAASIAVVFGLSRWHLRPPATRLAQTITEEAALLTGLEEPGLADLDPNDTDAVAEELELVETFMLAEATPSDEEWIEQTLRLLEQLEEDVPPEGAVEGTSGDEDWFEELQLLDDLEHSAAS